MTAEDIAQQVIREFDRLAAQAAGDQARFNAAEYLIQALSNRADDLLDKVEAVEMARG